MVPVTLLGKSLGERHRHLNAAVQDAHAANQHFNDLEILPEQSQIDRIFKINLSSKQRNTDYIVRNLKDDDMLYVSKALKCKWLLNPEYEHIINPEYLENCLYPTMITTAVTKMKKWISLYLKDQNRCQIFFLYYCDKNFKLSVKFLRNCSPDFIIEQFPKIIHKITPHDFKIFCEKNPPVAKVFFDTVLTDETLKVKYLSKEMLYFATLKSLLKSDSTLVLDITEKYHNTLYINPFSSRATKFIMKNHRKRFTQKPELYTAMLLNLKTLANCLNADDASGLIVTLARDNYLTTKQWFNYKQVEPLLKRIKPEDRALIKRKIFVEKDFGTRAQEWSYEMPSTPKLISKVAPIFKDFENNPYDYNYEMDFRAMLKNRKYANWEQCPPCLSAKTMLDKLFDEYRVASYDKTLFELRKKLKAESSAQTRQYMMLVLISKCGGYENNLASLIQLLSEYKNEPPQLRATAVRSLVKRASVWRAPADSWRRLLAFAHGLGLDGGSPEAACHEGIHAVLIRQILVDGTCDSRVLNAYLDNFSTFDEYSLTKNEKNVLADCLPKILFAKACAETEIYRTEYVLKKLLDVLTVFKLSIEKYPGLIAKIENLAKNNILVFTDILTRLFRSRIARRELFKVNYTIINTPDSFINALRHDFSVISPQSHIKLILGNDLPNKCKRYKKSRYQILNTRYQRFFQKISIYFNENDGLGKQYLNVLKTEPYHTSLAKFLALLLGDELALFIKNLDVSKADKEQKLFAAALRANAHLARPALHVDTFGWSAVGAKAVANKVLVCRNTEVEDYIQKLLQNKRTVKLAHVLSERNNGSNYLSCFNVLSQMKPTVALKKGFKILSRDKILTDKSKYIWEVIHPLIANFDIGSPSKKYVKLPIIEIMPDEIQPAYSVILYKINKKNAYYKSMSYLCHIENRLENINEEFIENILEEYLNGKLPDIPDCYSLHYQVDCNCLYIRIIIKYLLLCKTEEIQKRRSEVIGDAFFSKMQSLCSDENKKHHSEYLYEFLKSFRYFKVFLNNEYVSCLPTMTKALAWMKQNLPMEMYFQKFVHMHLNMLYYTAIRKTIDLLPNHGIDDDNQMEGRRLVGYIFGKSIAQELDKLKVAYFDSVQYLYKNVILKLSEIFLHDCEVFTRALIDGVLDESKTSNVLAVYLYTFARPRLPAAARDHVVNRLRKCEDIETQMIFSAETFLKA